MDPLTIGITLAKFVPDIIGLFKGDDAKESAQAVLAIAEKVTGKKGPDAAAAIEADPATALEFKKAVMADKHVAARLALENVQGARAMYKHHGTKIDEVIGDVMRKNLPYIVVLALANIIAVYILKDHGALVAIISNLIGVMIGQLISERQAVMNFCLGSSVGSKNKNKED